MAITGTIALDIFLVAGLLSAVLTDLRRRRISNRLTYSMMVVGVLANSAWGGWAGLSTSVFGWLAGLAIMLVPFALGTMGAGDAKLMAAIGAVKGSQFLFMAGLYACVAGGLLAVFYLARERRLASTMRFIAYGWFWALRGNEPRAGTIPYAPAIAAGVIVALIA